MDKEQKWLQNRLGRITASELDSITSASGKIIDGNIDYVRTKRFERNHGFSLPVYSHAMEVGKESEPYAVAWYRENYPQSPIIYSQELPEIPFWTNPYIPNFGASPDAFSADEMVVLEIKTTVGNSTIEFFFDPATSYEEKKARVWKEHGSQILGQFLSNPKVLVIRLLKYCPCNDDILQDTTSPIAPWRGMVFEFERKDFVASLAEMEERINLFNAFIASDINPSEFKDGRWCLKDGKLYHKPEEEKKK